MSSKRSSKDRRSAPPDREGEQSPPQGSAELERRWARWLVDRNRRGLRITLRFGLTLYPAFGLLDWFLAPKSALPWIWSIRALFVLVTLLLLAFWRVRLLERYVESISAAYLWLAAAGISVMTSYMGGLASPYYAGLIMTLVAAGLLFVWRPRVVFSTHAAIVGFFLVDNLLSGTIGTSAVALSNVAFLSANGLVAAVGQTLLYHAHRKQHGQRVRLAQATASLERAHAELKQLDQLKSRFFANMTHELRTPLALVLTPLELALDGEMGELTDAQRSSFQSMFKSALKLLKLIDDLLDLSRLEESRLRLEVKEHDLVEQLRSLIEETQVLARRKELTLRFQSQLQEARIWCDQQRMERVFVNLLSNAIKFTEPGGRVEVRLQDGSDHVEVVIEDDGPGFPPDKAELLFERFYQLDTGGARQLGGAGIGLALAKELVLLHGGTISAQSDGRRGARFVVTLRKGTLRHLPGIRIATPQSKVENGRPGSPSVVQFSARRDFRLLDIEEATDRRLVDRDADEGVRPYTALVVEDVPNVARLIHMTLRRQFRVLTARDGRQGIEVAQRVVPNLVVTDLMMPEVDGFELTRQLRADPRTRHVPILMLTARGEVENRVKGLEVGVDAYLAKPFSPKELLSCARRLVQSEEQTAERVLSQRMESLELVAAGLAHEMNNPLNYVKNALVQMRLDAERLTRLAESASESKGGESKVELERLAARLRDLHGVAESGLKRMSGTVELMSRYGRAGFRRSWVIQDVWEAVRTVVGVVLPATGRTTQVELEFQGDGTLECIPEEFNQVLTNLLQNAIEATPSEGGRVLVTGCLEGEQLVLTVKDNGPGLKPELRERLFTPFLTTKGPGAGMGLGLTIARRVVQGLGGTLRLVSPPGEGAVFVVRVARRRSRVARLAD